MLGAVRGGAGATGIGPSGAMEATVAACAGFRVPARCVAGAETSTSRRAGEVTKRSYGDRVTFRAAGSSPCLVLHRGSRRGDVSAFALKRAGPTTPADLQRRAHRSRASARVPRPRRGGARRGPVGGDRRLRRHHARVRAFASSARTPTRRRLGRARPASLLPDGPGFEA